MTSFESKSKRPKVFIEKIMPVNLLNEQVYYEHGGNPFKGLHRWYSRKPLSFSRASVLASLLPADISMEEFEYLLGLHPEKEGLSPNSQIKLYKTPPTDLRIQKVRDLCEKVWGKRIPTVLDAFAGGGSIPFEAARYGLNVFASDLNPVAVVTMKAAMEYPLKFGADLQQDIDKWVKWVGDEAQKRLAEFFPSNPGETVQNYLWAHTVVCLNCQSVVPLSPNWWLSKTSNYAGKGQERKVTSDWYAVKPIPNPKNKRVDFELIKGKKGKGTTIQTDEEEYDPDTTTTISRGVGKCPNCSSIIEDDVIKSQARSHGLGHQLYAVTYRQGKSSLGFRVPEKLDLEEIAKAESYLQVKFADSNFNQIIPGEERFDGFADRCIAYGLNKNSDYFNARQLLTLITYVEIINEAKLLLQNECEQEKGDAIATYLALVLDRCVDTNCRLSHWHSSRSCAERASAQHALNLMWCYPEVSGKGELWQSSADVFASDYSKLCSLFNTQSNSTTIPGLEQFVVQASSLQTPPISSTSLTESEQDARTTPTLPTSSTSSTSSISSTASIPLTSLTESEQDAHTTTTTGKNFNIQIDAASADNLYHISDNAVDAIITDPPYYATIQYAELSDFFYVWMKRTLGDIFPELFYSELTDKDREAVANPSRFRNMGASPEELANQDYEAKMALAFAEHFRVLRDDGVMTVQFNHKESGAWDVLAKSLIDSGFEITASWAVSTENPQNLHQAQKNSVSSTVLLVCRKRDPNAQQAWWDDLRPEVANLVEQRAPNLKLTTLQELTFT